MSEVHFQADLFGEIIKGLSTNIQELPSEKLADVATKLYCNLAKSKKEKVAVGETSFYIADQQRRAVNCLGIIKCKECGHEEGKFIGQEIKYCAGCGRRVRSEK